MDLKEFIVTWRARLQSLNANRTQDMLRIGNDLAALIKLRIQTEGKNYQGKPFSPYTLDYSKKRQEIGLQINYKDYTATGRLMANTQAYLVSEDETSTVVEITARSEENQNKLKGAYKKDKNILQPSAGEIDLVRQAQRERIRKHLKI